jgi:hypothetical protein
MLTSVDRSEDVISSEIDQTVAEFRGAGFERQDPFSPIAR